MCSSDDIMKPLIHISAAFGYGRHYVFDLQPNPPSSLILHLTLAQSLTLALARIGCHRSSQVICPTNTLSSWVRWQSAWR